MSSENQVIKEKAISNAIGAFKDSLTTDTSFTDSYHQVNSADKAKPNQSLLADITDIPAGVSTAAFGAIKAPLATGLNLASELPGTQYIMQGISKAIEGTGKGIAELTGVDEQTMANIITTGMNTLGLKSAGGTMETAGKA